MVQTKPHVAKITIEWNIDSEGYHQISDYLGRFINSSDQSRSAAVFDRENGWLLGEQIDTAALAEKWFRDLKFGSMKEVLREFHRDGYSSVLIRTCKDMDWGWIFVENLSFICAWVGYGIDCDTSRRILASSTATSRDRDVMKWFEPSMNYDLETGKDWEIQHKRVEIQAFNDVSNWPPKGLGGKRTKGGRLVKPFNGWKRYGINPKIDEKHRPGFWANVFYACEDHQRVEAYENGEWYMVNCQATAEVECCDAAGAEFIEVYESGYSCGIESDAGKEFQKEAEQERLAELKRQIEEAGVKWPENPEINYTGDVPY